MKTYIAPSIEVNKAQTCHMLAESLAINSETTVNGADALTKEATWDIWDEQ